MGPTKVVHKTIDGPMINPDKMNAINNVKRIKLYINTSNKQLNILNVGLDH